MSDMETNKARKNVKGKDMSKDLYRYFSKDNISMTSKYIKRCLVIREIQIKTTMGSHFTPKMAIIERQMISTSGENVRKFKLFYIAGKNVKWCSPCGK